MEAHKHTDSHTAVFYLPGSSRRWWYSVNLNTQILDILYGCELLSNSNQYLASVPLTFLPAGHCHRTSPREPLPHVYRLLLSRHSNSVFHSPALQLPTEHQDSMLELCQHILLFMMGPVVASSLLNVKGMLIKPRSTPAHCWNQGAKIYSVSMNSSETNNDPLCGNALNACANISKCIYTFIWQQ